MCNPVNNSQKSSEFSLFLLDSWDNMIPISLFWLSASEFNTTAHESNDVGKYYETQLHIEPAPLPA